MTVGAAMAGLLALVAVIYVTAAFVLFFAQNWLIYRRSRQKPDRERAGLSDMAEVRLLTEDKAEIYAWYKGPTAGRTVLLYLPGNYGHIGNRGQRLRYFLDCGLGCLIVAYRGFSGNGGRPSERGLVEDGRAAIGFLEAQGILANRIVLCGESLGAAIAVRLATLFPVEGLVLEAPFSDLAVLATEKLRVFPIKLMLRDRFASSALIGEVRCPVLILHGTNDRFVPPRHSQDLYARAGSTKVLRTLDGAGHYDLYKFGAAKIIVDFMRQS
jgi:uncharacterized protein